MNRKRGGQEKHWALRARALMWYWKVKKSCDWSDYQLDNAFAWREESMPEFSIDARPRMFEWLRKEGREPAGRDPRWRAMPELVVAVDQHPLFHGSRALYEAELWPMFMETSVTPDILEDRVNRLVNKYDLVRLATHEFLAVKIVPVYFDNLRLSIKNLPLLPKIELVWCLYLQNISHKNIMFRRALEMIVCRSLKELFNDELKGHFDFYTEASAALISTKVDTSLVVDPKEHLFNGRMIIVPRKHADFRWEIIKSSLNS